MAKFININILKHSMAVKTITVTEDAYNSLKAKKGETESFSDTILRITRYRSLKEFAGALSEKTAEKLEKGIRERRKQHRIAHHKRIERIADALRGKHGSS